MSGFLIRRFGVRVPDGAPVIYGGWDCSEWSSALQAENQMESFSISSTNEDFKYQICDSLIKKNTCLRGAGQYRNIKFELNFSHSKVWGHFKIPTRGVRPAVNVPTRSWVLRVKKNPPEGSTALGNAHYPSPLNVTLISKTKRSFMVNNLTAIQTLRVRFP